METCTTASASSATAPSTCEIEQLPSELQVSDIYKSELSPGLKVVTTSQLNRNIDGVILVVNKAEWHVALTFLNILGTTNLVTMSNVECYVCSFAKKMKKHTLLLVRLTSKGGSSGPSGSQALVTSLLDSFSPRFVMSIGCAGSIDRDKYKRGDVLFSDEIFPYSYRKADENRNARQDVHQDLKVMVRNASGSGLWKVEKVAATDEAMATMCNLHTGPILSGDQLIVSEKIITDLEQLVGYDPIGVEMEGTGVWAACKTQNVPSAICKGVSDFCIDKRDQTVKEKIEAQVRASVAAFSFFRFAFERALANDALPPHWRPVMCTDVDTTHKIPMEVKADHPMYPALKRYVSFVEKYDNERSKPLTDDITNLRQQITNLKDSIKIIKQTYNTSIAPLKKQYDNDVAPMKKLCDSVQQKLDKLDKNKKMTLDAKNEDEALSEAWFISSNVAQVNVDSKDYELERVCELADVKWSAKEVRDRVNPLQFMKMIKELRGESKIKFKLRCQNKKWDLIGKQCKRARKSATSDAAASPASNN